MSFLNPGYAPWLLLIALPVVIHLLTRQAVRVYALPTFRFVQKSIARQSKIFRLRHLLLLLLRTALVAMLVMVFLKPTRTAPLAVAGAGRTVVIILDASASMAWAGNGVSTFRNAQTQAIRILDGLGPGDRANVILADAAPNAVLRRPAGDFAALRHAVKSAAPTEERCDVTAAIAMASEHLSKDRKAGQELYVISDFQRTNWADAKLDSIPQSTRVVFVGAEETTRDNTAVTGIRLKPAFPRAGEETTALVEVWNGTSSPRRIPVIWRGGDGADGGRSTMDDAKNEATSDTRTSSGNPSPAQNSVLGTRYSVLGTQSSSTSPSHPLTPSPAQLIDVPPFATGTASFPVDFGAPGRYVCSASVPKDALPADDTRYLVADLQHSLTVLLMTDEDAERSPSASYFVSRALNPDPGQPGGIRIVPRRAAELSDADLKSADVVILAGVQAFPADRLPKLGQYLKAGGSLVFFLYGERAVAQAAALQSLAGGSDGLPFLPTSLVDVRRKGKGYVTLSEARYESRLLKLFKDPAAADLGQIEFYRFFLTTEPDSRAEVLLKFEDGTTAAARRPFGAGSVLMCNFSPSLKDSDLARQEVFPPLLHEMLKGLAARDTERREFAPGSAASATIGPAKGRVAAIDPFGKPCSISVDRTGGGVVIERVERAGIYSVTLDGRDETSIAVNVSPDESDLRTLDPRELQAQQDRRPAYLVGPGARNLEDLHKNRPLWPYIIIAAFAALAAEQWLAGMGRKPKQ